MRGRGNQVLHGFLLRVMFPCQFRFLLTPMAAHTDFDWFMEQPTWIQFAKIFIWRFAKLDSWCTPLIVTLKWKFGMIVSHLMGISTSGFVLLLFWTLFLSGFNLCSIMFCLLWSLIHNFSLFSVFHYMLESAVNFGLSAHLYAYLGKGDIMINDIPKTHF